MLPSPVFLVSIENIRNKSAHGKQVEKIFTVADKSGTIRLIHFFLLKSAISALEIAGKGLSIALK